MLREWKDIDKGVQYYYQKHSGLIVGQVYNLAYTGIWGAKIPINATEELILGQYIGLEFAKLAVQEHWNKKDRTLEAVHEYLLSPPRSESSG
jgi:hypothetical protein